MAQTELTKILAKINYRVAWDEWDLTEAEYEVLDRATGEEIASIAYKNGLNLTNLLKNSDDLIEERNQRVQKKLLRDIKNMKLDLMSSSPRVRKARTPPPDFEEIDRRILSETIAEVSSLDSPLPPAPADKQQQDEFDWQNVNVEDILKEKSIVPPEGFSKSSFASKIQDAAGVSTLQSPSLHRNVLSNVTMQEIIPTDPDINNLQAVEEFQDPTNEELADLGMFSGKFGRDLFNKINNVESRPPSLIPDFIMPDEHVEPILLDETLDKLLAIDFQPSQLTPSVEKSTEKSKKIDKFEAQQIELEDVAGNSQILPPGTPKTPKADTQRASTSIRMSRVDYLEKIIDNIVDKQPQKRKPRGRARKVRRLPENDSDLLEINQDLIWHQRRPKSVRPYKPKVELRITNNIFEWLEDYEDDQVFSDEDEPVVNEKTLAAPLIDDINFVPLSELDNLPCYTTPIIRHESKRPRLDINHEDNPIHFELQPDLRKSSASFSEPRANYQDFNPKIISTGARKKISISDKIPAQEVEFKHLESVSEKMIEEGRKLLFNQNDTTRSSQLKRTVEDGIDENGRVLFRRVKGKDEPMIEFVGVGHKVERVSEYCLETFALYMQVRFIMKQQNTWKMNFDELLTKISLLNPKAKRICYENRFFLMSDYKFVNLTLTIDEEHIVEVEIPIDQGNN